MNKVKPIVLEYEDGKTYTLEFSRASVRFAERMGFSLASLGQAPMTATENLFWFAFRMHHPNLKKADTDKILYEDLGGLTEEALTRLADLYEAPFATLVDDEEDGEEKNAKAKMHL